jgi:hypothetical protein
VGAQSAIQTSGAATWSPVLVFGAVTTGIGLLGFSLAGGLRSFLDFMRTDPH